MFSTDLLFPPFHAVFPTLRPNRPTRSVTFPALPPPSRPSTLPPQIHHSYPNPAHPANICQSDSAPGAVPRRLRVRRLLMVSVLRWERGRGGL